MTEEEWEKTRDDRVQTWRNFSSKKTVIGTKKSNKQIRAPQVKLEERPPSTPKFDPTLNKPMGINEDYKKTQGKSISSISMPIEMNITSTELEKNAFNLIFFPIL